MSAVKRGQLRVLCGAVGADQQPASLSASQTLSDQAVQSAQLTGNRGSLIEFLLLTALFFFFLPLSLAWRRFLPGSFFFPLPAVRKQTVQNRTRKHSWPHQRFQFQTLICPPTCSIR